MLAELTVDDPKLLVGPSSFDDAGAYEIEPDLVILNTADVITPVCDDPFLFGQIAAANALSDVYAMGGRPVTVLNLAFFSERMPQEQQRRVLAGAAAKVREAGAVVVGGHTLQDREVKFGLAVTGRCRRAELLTNAGARPGDRLVLTKALGTGSLLSAWRKGWLSDEAPVMRECLEQMATLNAAAAELAHEHGAHAATDVTGFGLGGHAVEMARASRVQLLLRPDALPVYESVPELLRRGARTGLAADNLALLERHLVGPAPVETLELLADAQTSGGLLVSLPAARADAYVARLHERGASRAAVVGSVEAGTPAGVRVS